MADYDFSTLNSYDLEELVCDLLNANKPNDSPVYYRTFKDGKDKGIDILYSSPSYVHDHIGQVKHFYRTGRKGLLSVLKNEELPKVKVLNPNKYILATSLDLSVGDVETIKEIFQPFITTLQDIYGKKDLNRLLETHNQVLTNHYKLWFSSTSMLAKVLNSELEFRSSDFVETEFKRRLRIYVRTPLFDKARKFLKKNKFIIITGEPGVGKTTLAEMLAYEYILEDYKLTYIYDDIKDADKALTHDDKKQIIYFDDFLGSNAVEINRAKGNETSLRKVLKRIMNSSNKLMIFTTRSFLLHTAIAESENLSRFNIKAKESILALSEYTTEVKQQLLQNHIEDSGLRAEFKQYLSEPETQNIILNHTSFTPRLAEFITTNDIVMNLTLEQYKQFVLSSLKDPRDVWEHAYAEQIKEDDRLLLNTLLSFGEHASKQELEIAFNQRLKDEAITNNKPKVMHAYSQCLKRLLGGFLIIKNADEIHFINPSLIDFLLQHLRKDQDEVFRMADAVRFTKQLTTRLFSLSGSEKLKIPKSLETKLVDDYHFIVTDETRDLDLIRLALVFYKYIKHEKRDDIICEILTEIDDWNSLYEDYSLNYYFREFIGTTQTNAKINFVIKERIVEILEDLVLGENEIDRALTALEELLAKFEINLAGFEKQKIDQHFNELLADYIEQEIDWLKDFITDESEAYDKKIEIEETITRLKEAGIAIEQNLKTFDSISWFNIAIDNQFRTALENDE